MKFRNRSERPRDTNSHTVVKTTKTVCVYLWLALVVLGMAVHKAQTETIYYTLNNVILNDSTQMTGVFSWTYEVDDFENGVGQFASLSIPWTSHNQDDLDATIDIGSSIEITLEGSVHDDGIDITLFLSEPLTTSNSSQIDLARSKYEIGGNGFHDGAFQSGTITLTNITLNITLSAPGHASLSWGPAIPGYVLQESPTLTSFSWTNSASGSTNPVVVPITGPAKFYRLINPQAASASASN